MNSTIATPQLIAWLEFVFIWAFLSFGLTTDGRRGDRKAEDALRWQWGLACRAIAILILATWFCGSWILGMIASATLVAQAQARYRLARLSIANECIPPIALCLVSFAFVERFSISPEHQIRFDIGTNHFAALLVVGSTFCLALRWGAYLVKGVLHLALPHEGMPDQDEIKRGFLIGILERILLTIVVALGSFSALGFLVAAKGLVRSHQFEGKKSRDFTEYFLIGTLTSTLVAVCAGLLIRGALHLLWPELLLLDMKAD